MAGVRVCAGRRRKGRCAHVCEERGRAGVRMCGGGRGHGGVQGCSPHTCRYWSSYSTPLSLYISALKHTPRSTVGLAGSNDGCGGANAESPPNGSSSPPNPRGATAAAAAAA
eukprot:78085-Chlamydomonas_euryale.AAC.1